VSRCEAAPAATRGVRADDTRERRPRADPYHRRKGQARPSPRARALAVHPPPRRRRRRRRRRCLARGIGTGKREGLVAAVSVKQQGDSSIRRIAPVVKH
jgi:hypothetical protein